MSDVADANIIAYLALVAWFPVSWLLFATLRPALAAAATVLGAAMFLPEIVAIDAPVVPPFDKQVIGPLAALTGALWACPKRVTRARPYRGIDIAFVGLILGGFGTIILNNDRIVYGPTILPALTSYDALAMFVKDHLTIFIPFFIGRALFRTPRDLVDLVRVFALAGIVYSVCCIIEVRLSPQLHNWVYGFLQHDFVQTMRGGGYRPMVFMSHGISVARFMFGTLIAAAALWRSRLGILQGRGGWWVFYLAAVLLLCKSTGAIVFAVGCLPLVMFAKAKTQMRVAVALACLVILFPVIRAADLFPTDTLTELALEVSEERAHSLGGRFMMEDLLLERARERMLFGWGAYGRYRVYDTEKGTDLSVTDGEWMITLGQRGAIGFVAWYVLYLAPIFALWKRFAHIKGEKLQRMASGAALFVVVFIVDTLPNSSGSFPQFFVSGALFGLATGAITQRAATLGKPRSKRVAERARRTAHAPPAYAPLHYQRSADTPSA